MKIGFDAKRAFLNSSGLGIYSRNTLNALSRYFPDNSYILFTPRAGDSLFENSNEFKTVSPPKIFPKQLKSLWRSLLLIPALMNNSIDLYHGLSNELPKGIHRTDIFSVVTIHDLIFMRYPELYGSVDRHIYCKKVKYACRAADSIIAISQQTKNDLENFFQVKPEKIKVIHQSVSQIYFQSHPENTIIKKYSIPEKFILSVGTVEKRKNQLQLLKAIKRCNINVPLVFVGRQTSYINELMRYIEKKDMNNQAIFLSNIPESDLAALYQRACLSVYISIFEGFGLPVIESMASGCPVITSNSSCLPETAGDAALLVSPEDEMEIGNNIAILLNDNKIRNQIIEKGHQHAALFHPENYAKNLTDLYRSILSDDFTK